MNPSFNGGLASNGTQFQPQHHNLQQQPSFNFPNPTNVLKSGFNGSANYNIGNILSSNLVSWTACFVFTGFNFWNASDVCEKFPWYAKALFSTSTWLLSVFQGYFFINEWFFNLQKNCKLNKTHIKSWSFNFQNKYEVFLILVSFWISLKLLSFKLKQNRRSK